VGIYYRWVAPILPLSRIENPRVGGSIPPPGTISRQRASPTGGAFLWMPPLCVDPARLPARFCLRAPYQDKEPRPSAGLFCGCRHTMCRPSAAAGSLLSPGTISRQRVSPTGGAFLWMPPQCVDPARLPAWAAPPLLSPGTISRQRASPTGGAFSWRHKRGKVEHGCQHESPE
jgi:hypothetical protein